MRSLNKASELVQSADLAHMLGVRNAALKGLVFEVFGWRFLTQIYIFSNANLYIFFIMFHFLFLSESGGCCRSKKLSYQELGIAKLSGFCEWLSIHPVISESDGVAKLDVNHSSQKMIIFAHHLKVLDGVQVRCFYQFSFLFARLKTSS